MADACSLLASPPLTPKGRSGRKYRSLFQNPASFHRITAEEEAFIRRLNSGAAARSREVSSSWKRNNQMIKTSENKHGQSSEPTSSIITGFGPFLFLLFLLQDEDPSAPGSAYLSLLHSPSRYDLDATTTTREQS